MSVYEIGKVCVKLLGREAGYLCTVVEVIDKNFALIDSTGKVKRRRCNFKHLVPTKYILEIKKGANRKAIEEAVDKAKLKEKFETKNVPKLQL